MPAPRRAAPVALIRKIACCLLPVLLGVSAAFVLLLTAGGPVRAAYAGTLIFPGCASTIQGCIDIANPGDTVLISAGDYTESLTLSKAVSLTGALSSTTIIHALPNMRVLTVTGAAVNSSVVISGLTFTGGNLTNTSSCPEGCGAGVLITGAARPQLENLIVQGNTAGRAGGGLFSNGFVTIRGSRFQDNACMPMYPCNGGGLYVVDTLTLLDTQFVSNTSQGNGGGAYFSSTATLTGATFVGNRAFGLYGGGAYFSSTAMLVRAVFRDNSSGFQGGGAFLASPAALSDSTFISNTAYAGGGAAFFGDTTVTGGSFLSNTAFEIGGGAYFSWPSALTSTVFAHNKVSSVSSGLGGGAEFASPASLSGVIFTDNTATYGGGAYFGNPSTLAGSMFARNAANTGGGAYFVYQSVVVSTTFISNTAEAEGGGAYGGFILGQMPWDVQNSLFLGNAAQTNGGGLSLALGDGQIVNSLFARNSAGGGNGTALYLASPGSIAIRQSTIASATLGSGAAIGVVTGTVDVKDTIIASYTIGISLTAGTVDQDFNFFAGVPISVAGAVAGGTHSAMGDADFNDPQNDDYHIGVASLARDTGTDAGVATDIDGDVRPVNSGFDIGYDEYGNWSPTAGPDTYHTRFNTQLAVAAPGLLANDVDNNSDPLIALLDSGPLIGSLDLGPVGAFTYTAPLDFTGLVTFTYQSSDGVLMSPPAVVSISVDPNKLYLPLVVH